MSLKPTFAALVVITFVGAAIRLYLLADKTFWLDEAASWQIGSWPWDDFWTMIFRFEGNMVFYHLLLRAWLHIGESEWVIRSLSVIFGVATIPALYILGSRLFSRKAGLIGAAFLSVHAYHVRYSQEARSYSLLALLLVLSAYFFVRAVHIPRDKKFWVAYSLVSALAVYAHAFAIFVLLAQRLSLGFSKLRRIGSATLLGVLGTLAVLITPVIAFLLLQDQGQLDWISEPTLKTLRRHLRLLTGNGGYILFIAYIALSLFAVLSPFRSGSASPAVPDERWSVTLLALWVVFPIVAIFSLSFLKPILVDRYMLMCVPALVLLAGQGIARLSQVAPWMHKTAPLALLLVTWLSLWGLHRYFQDRAADQNQWRPSAQYVLARQQRGDGIIFYSSRERYPFAFQVQQEINKTGYEFLPTELFPFPSGRPPDSLKSPTRNGIERIIRGYARLWLVTPKPSKSNISRTLEVRQNKALITRSLLSGGFQLKEEEHLDRERDRIVIDLYVREQK